MVESNGICLLVIPGAIQFSRKHPLSCWASSMVVIFAGSLLANLIMGEPMLSPFKNNNQLLLATAVWYEIISHIDFTYFKCNYVIGM